MTLVTAANEVPGCRAVAVPNEIDTFIVVAECGDRPPVTAHFPAAVGAVYDLVIPAIVGAGRRRLIFVNGLARRMALPVARLIVPCRVEEEIIVLRLPAVVEQRLSLIKRTAVVHIRQARAALKCEGRNLCDGQREAEDRQTGAVIERAVADRSQALGQGDVGQGAAAVEGSPADAGHTLRDHDAGQRAAVVEAHRVDRGQALRKRHFTEAAAVREGLTQIQNTVGNARFGQRAAVRKGVVVYVGHTGADHDFSDAAAVFVPGEVGSIAIVVHRAVPGNGQCILLIELPCQRLPADAAVDQFLIAALMVCDMHKAVFRVVVPGPEIHKLSVDQKRAYRERHGTGIAHLSGNAPHEVPAVQREDDIAAVRGVQRLEGLHRRLVVSVHVGGNNLDRRVADPCALRQTLYRVSGVPAHGAIV